MNPLLPFSKATTVNHNFLGETYPDKYTAQISTLTYADTGTPFKDYSLGYVKTDDLPDVFRRSKVEETAQNIIFDYATPDGNYPCGYLSCTQTVAPFTEFTWISGLLVKHGSNNIRFINELYPELSNCYATATLPFNLAIRGNVWKTGESSPIRYDFSGYLTFATIDEFRDFLQSTANIQKHITGTITHSGITYNVDFKFTPQNIDREMHIQDENEPSIEFSCYICGYQFYSIAGNNFFAVEVPEVDGGIITKWIVGGNQVGTTSTNLAMYDGSTQTLTVNFGRTKPSSNNQIPGGMYGSFPLEYVRLGTTAILKDGNVVCIHQNSNNNIHYFFRIYSINEIKRHLSIFLYREAFYSNTQQSYSINLNTAIKVDSDDRFRTEQRNGSITDDTFKNELREWQYIDRDDTDPDHNGISKNEFNPDTDIPAYEPDPPQPDDVIPTEPDDEGFAGDDPGVIPDAEGDTPGDNSDRLVTSATKFITQYILTASQVFDLGGALWGGWLSDGGEYRKNFGWNVDWLQDSGTFDISRAIQFIVSLRVFPFNIIDMGIDYISAVNGLYMGTGHTDFLNAGSVATLQSVVGAINCGTATVTPLDANTYNDFRDIYNTTVSVFLPYCGVLELNPADVMYRELDCSYYIDFQSGECTAVVHVTANGLRFMVGSMQGHIGFLIPVTATNAGQVTAGMFKNAVGVLSTVGNTALDFASTLATKGAIGKSKKSDVNKQLGNTNANIQMGSEGVSGVSSITNEIVDSLFGSAVNVPYMSGGSGAESMLFPSQPYVHIRRGKYALPKQYKQILGWKSRTDEAIENFSGFCIFSNVNVTGLTCTEEEQAEIKALLESGVYV